MKKSILIFTFSIFIALQQLAAQSASPTPNCSTNPPDFISLTYSQANHAVKIEENLILTAKVKVVCLEYITNLISQVKSVEVNNSNKVLAIYLLGALRPSDTNAIETLIELIDFRAVVFDSKSAIMRWGEYPAQESLIAIGQPSIAPIFFHLQTETNELRRQLMCGVVRSVAGWAVGMECLRQQNRQETDEARRKNLDLSIKELEKLPH